MPRMRWWRGSAPDPAGRAHVTTLPQTLQSAGEGERDTPSPRTPPPRRLQRVDPRTFGARCSANRAANGLRPALPAWLCLRRSPDLLVSWRKRLDDFTKIPQQNHKPVRSTYYTFTSKQKTLDFTSGQISHRFDGRVSKLLDTLQSSTYFRKECLRYRLTNMRNNKQSQCFVQLQSVEKQMFDSAH